MCKRASEHRRSFFCALTDFERKLEMTLPVWSRNTLVHFAFDVLQTEPQWLM